MMQMHYFYETCTLAHREGGWPLFTSCREEFFSAARLPLNSILGNSGHEKSRGC